MRKWPGALRLRLRLASRRSLGDINRIDDEAGRKLRAARGSNGALMATAWCGRGRTCCSTPKHGTRSRSTDMARFTAALGLPRRKACERLFLLELSSMHIAKRCCFVQQES